ncbi:hypothetical protein DRO97_01805 [Archaeoglobales archaeon]|nr:MAG: hypothetical protein DRO97_01805 [Archaeoglobales archaeon]
MKTVLWISRHKPISAQLDELGAKLGEFKLVEYRKPLSTAQDAVKLAIEVKADYVIPVLPMTFIMYLVAEARKYNFTVLKAEMQNLHTCKEVPCPDYNWETDTIMESKDYNTRQIIRRHFRFRGFVILKDIKIITEVF